ncbi:hypothetical protein KIN20_032236 [Parelaphostrongylus tenuis]|uniref:Uncharacterized protein n=1 Tax=Parelaphostrongylus tenuis TaxID=148309 RepID=A0AAD5WHW7_PARTN|nr:hypothetical protein KIN20_032236 [Parelaphostrongylus tenuis]
MKEVLNLEVSFVRIENEASGAVNTSRMSHTFHIVAALVEVIKCTLFLHTDLLGLSAIYQEKYSAHTDLNRIECVACPRRDFEPMAMFTLSLVTKSLRPISNNTCAISASQAHQAQHLIHVPH